MNIVKIFDDKGMLFRTFKNAVYQPCLFPEIRKYEIVRDVGKPGQGRKKLATLELNPGWVIQGESS